MSKDLYVAGTRIERTKFNDDRKIRWGSPMSAPECVRCCHQTRKIWLRHASAKTLSGGMEPKWNIVNFNALHFNLLILWFVKFAEWNVLECSRRSSEKEKQSELWNFYFYFITISRLAFSSRLSEEKKLCIRLEDEREREKKGGKCFFYYRAINSFNENSTFRFNCLLVLEFLGEFGCYAIASFHIWGNETICAEMEKFLLSFIFPPFGTREKEKLTTFSHVSLSRFRICRHIPSSRRLWRIF